ncbi:MAG TPA: lipoprotein [Xanthobacteraceae bacterium]|nr:lipoprotein [Xanthobacteraceae bacterium]
MNSAPLPFVALLLALGLAGCGVKGPLEPPPQSGIHPNEVQAEPATVPVPPGTTAAHPLDHAPAVAEMARRTTAPAVRDAPAAQRRSVLDWLID